MKPTQKIAANFLSNNGRNGIFWCLIPVGALFVSLLFVFILFVLQLFIASDISELVYGYTFFITNILATLILLSIKRANDGALDFNLSWFDAGALSIHAGLLTGIVFGYTTGSFYYGFLTGNFLFAIFLLLIKRGVFKTNEELRPTQKTVGAALWAPYALLLALLLSLIVSMMIKEAVLNFWRGQTRK